MLLDKARKKMEKSYFDSGDEFHHLDEINPQERQLIETLSLHFWTLTKEGDDKFKC